MSESKGRVLLVDPDPMTRLAIGRQIEMLGWDVLCVNSGGEAIRVIELGLHIDVLLAEVRLPDLGGPAAAAAVGRLAPRVRVAFMNGEAPADGTGPRQAPCLVKPCATDALARALAEAPPIGGDGPADLTPHARASRPDGPPRRARTAS